MTSSAANEPQCFPAAAQDLTVSVLMINGQFGPFVEQFVWNY